MTDKQLIRFVTAFRGGILGKQPSRAMCAAVCYPLVGLLSFHGVRAEVIEVDLSTSDLDALSHVWLRLPDGRALDPTADQFGGPPVYLGPPTAYHQPAG